ncbi:MAG TPA: hypothetical protein VK190_03285 [Pseudoneobacillus sp.]|jgi:hypothetical protein|nr:hypothetical protein [Pseudoneobacillus sp.]
MALLGMLKTGLTPAASNLGLGIKPTLAAGVVTFGVFGAASTLGGLRSAAITKTTGTSEYYGTMPDLAYDAQGQVDRKTGDKSLGATGDLVFGLNSSRHGR